MTITLPTKMTINESFQLLEACKALRSEEGEVIVDASGCQMFGPVGIAILGVELARRRLLGASSPTLVLPKDPDAKTFLDEISFSKVVILGERAPSGTLAIRELNALDPLFTESVAHLIAERVPGADRDDSVFAIQLCLTELLQNVFEHSESKLGCLVLARWYKNTGSVRLAVADGGIGIPAALRRKRIDGMHRLTDQDVLVEAISRQGLTSRTTGAYGGYGLKHIRGIATSSQAGRLSAISLSAKVVFRGDKIGKYRSSHFQGTAIEVEFRPEDYAPANGEGVF